MNQQTESGSVEQAPAEHNQADTQLALATQAQQVLAQADLIYSAEQVNQAIDVLAEQINSRLGGMLEPVIAMPIMNGGLVLSGHLLTRLDFPVVLDYLHATRYRDKTTGSDLQWKARPQQSLENKTLLIIDDILDEGYTLEAVRDYCYQQGAEQVFSVLLVEKNHPRPKADIQGDFIGLQVEDRYVFGFGMDYKGHHRSLNAIYAVNESQSNG